MSLAKSPGETFYPTVNWGATGATLGVGIRNVVTGAYVVARTTVGVVEDLAENYVQRAGLVAPTTAGTFYEVVWDDTVDFVTEDLTVTYSAAAASVPLATDLCTVADVRTYLQKGGTETAQDTVIQTFITAASAQIEKLCERDFANRTATTRMFAVDGALVNLNPHDLRTATTVTLDPNGSPTVITAYKLEPIGASILGTYTMLRLPASTSLSSTAWSDYGYGELSILGNWGPSAIPPDVALGCVKTVALWIRREVAARGSGNPDFELDAVDNRPRAIPGAVVGTLEPYRRMSVA